MTVKAISFVAKSGTGKTTLLEKVISELKRRGYTVGAIKHDAHRFDIDHPGKDSFRMTAAGADTMLISSPEKLAVVKKHAASPPIEELLETYFSDVDVVLTEGFKKSGLPKIELHRSDRSATLICRGDQDDPSLLAVASDAPLQIDVPLLDLNDPVQVADFVESRIIRGEVEFASAAGGIPLDFRDLLELDLATAPVLFPVENILTEHLVDVPADIAGKLIASPGNHRPVETLAEIRRNSADKLGRLARELNENLRREES